MLRLLVAGPSLPQLLIQAQPCVHPLILVLTAHVHASSQVGLAQRGWVQMLTAGCCLEARLPTEQMMHPPGAGAVGPCHGGL